LTKGQDMNPTALENKRTIKTVSQIKTEKTGVSGSTGGSCGSMGARVKIDYSQSKVPSAKEGRGRKQLCQQNARWGAEEGADGQRTRKEVFKRAKTAPGKDARPRAVV